MSIVNLVGTAVFGRDMVIGQYIFEMRIRFAGLINPLLPAKINWRSPELVDQPEDDTSIDAVSIVQSEAPDEVIKPLSIKNEIASNEPQARKIPDGHV